MTRKILAVVSDTHGGHKLGLMAPDVVLQDEDEEGNPVPYTPQQTASQRYLWDLYQKGIKAVCDLASGDEIIVIHNGDLTQGNKYQQNLVSTRMSDQIVIAVSNLLPWTKLPNVKAMRISKGTQAHNFGEGAADYLVSEMLRSNPALDAKCVSHGMADVNGVSVDYAHHGPPPGSRKWLEGNEARYYLRDLMLRDIMAGIAPPKLVLRAHYHQYTYERVQIGDYVSYLCITPSMCLLDDHAAQAVKSPAYIGNGIVAWELIDGELSDPRTLIRRVDIRTKEEL